MLSPESGRHAILALRIHIDLDDPTSRAFLEDCVGLLAARPALELWAVCPREQRRRLPRALGDALATGQVRAFFYPRSKGALRIWPCDDGKPLRDGGLLISTKNDPPSIGHRNAHIFMAKHMNLALVGSPIAFEGGDVLCGERHVFVGRHTLEKNPAAGRSAAQLARALGTLFAKPVFVLETPKLKDPNLAKQFRHPMHVDTEVCLVFDRVTKRETVLVGDPKTLVEVILGLQPNRLRGRRAFAAAVREAFRGSSLGDYFVDPLIAVNWEGVLRARRHARALRRHGYPVQFVPGFAGLSSPLDSLAAKKKQEKKILRLLNYVNAVVDRGVVFLPWFEIPRLDSWTQEIVERLGYEVVPARSARHSFTHLGGPHCLTSAIRFRPSGART